MISIMVKILSYLYFCIRPVVKWFLRKTTRLCELQRVCYGIDAGFLRTQKIESSLELSRTKEIQQMVQQLDQMSTEGRFTDQNSRNCVEFAIKLTLDVKAIKPTVHAPFINNYRDCLFQIYGYKQFLHEIEVLRKTQYCADNNLHEEKLLQVWNLLNPEEPLLSRVSKQWGDIGFQGDDPKTDFRGMGILGLDNLLYFVSEHTKAARHVLLHSSHPDYGYSFAIVGINLTSMAYHLLKEGVLKTHFYNGVSRRPRLEDFHYVYCYLFYEFDKLWLAEKPRDIMEFNRIRSKFEDIIRTRLKDSKARLRLSFIVKTL